MQSLSEGRHKNEETPRLIIVNADDFGLTEGVNRGIIEAHEKGVVTSASLMVRYRAAEQAGQYASAHPRLSVGLHFDVEEWCCRAGTWEKLYVVVDSADAQALDDELERQLARFEALVGRRPTHLDSHQHVHLSEPARSLLGKQAERLSIPLRACDPSIIYNGSFYGQTSEGETVPEQVSVTSFLAIVESQPAGWTEMGCHPGYAEGLHSVYSAEREGELRVLCSPALRDSLAERQVELRSFHDFLAL